MIIQSLKSIKNINIDSNNIRLR